MSKNNFFNLSNRVVNAIIYLLLGVLLIVLKQSIIEWAMLIFGVLFVVLGVLNVIRGGVIPGAVQIVIGALIILFRFVAQNVVMIIFGILLAVSGLSQLLNGGSKKLFPLISCILSIVGGVMIIFNSSSAVSFVYIICGIVFIVNGIVSLFDKK